MHDFHEKSKVWIYLSDRVFTSDEESSIQHSLNQFVKEWTAHGANLKASGEIRFNRFIILMVDETAAGASGCSIDKSVHFIKSIENQYGVQLFNRMLFAWKRGEEVFVSHLNKLQELFDHGEITGDTIVFNNLVATKKERNEKWMVPLKDSWMSARLMKQKV